MTASDRIGADDLERQVIHNINEFGWHAVNVIEDDNHPPWSYPIGFHDTWNRSYGPTTTASTPGMKTRLGRSRNGSQYSARHQPAIDSTLRRVDTIDAHAPVSRSSRS